MINTYMSSTCLSHKLIHYCTLQTVWLPEEHLTMVVGRKAKQSSPSRVVLDKPLEMFLIISSSHQC